MFKIAQVACREIIDCVNRFFTGKVHGFFLDYYYFPSIYYFFQV